MWYVETKYKRTKGLQVHDEHAYILEPFDDEALAIKQNSEYKNAELLCFDGLSDETRRIGSSMLPIDLDILEEKNQFRILNNSSCDL